jgi:glycosyltransferase involved in cell wall biosynthesis
MRTWWIVPEKSGGIKTYAESLLAAAVPAGLAVRTTWALPETESVRNAEEEVVHLQHEFGLFGSKLPGFYRFPKWIRSARECAPGKAWIATAHTVLDRDWRYRTEGRGWRALPLAALNRFVVPAARRAWMDGTWGTLDGVVVHSELQARTIRDSGCPRVAVIPHFVPSLSVLKDDGAREPTAVLFGYFSWEKGQDLALRAWAEWGSEAPKLVLAGGLRRKEDAWYLRRCEALVKKFGLESKVEITGYVPEHRVSEIYARATVVIAPFRETSGSGSLALALAHHAPVLASDLPLNREVLTRVPESAALFSAGDPESLAREARALFRNETRRGELSAGARRYAEAHSPVETLRRHREFYADVLTQLESRGAR